MSARARKPPTQEPPDRPSLDDQPTTVFDSDEHPGQRKGSRGAPTVLDKPAAGAVLDKPAAGSHPTPTIVDKPAAASRAAPTVPARPAPAAVKAITNKDAAAKPAPTQEPAAIQVISKKNESEPMRAISMKTPGEGRAPQPENPPTPMLARPKLRAVSEVTPAKQQNLGNLASPYDPKAARARATQEYVIWGCVAVILASAIALVVWFVAR